MSTVDEFLRVKLDNHSATCQKSDLDKLIQL